MPWHTRNITAMICFTQRSLVNYCPILIMKYSNCLTWDNVSLMQSMDSIWYQVFVDLVNNLQLSLRQNGAVHLNIQYVPWNMHTVCAVYWLSDAVACSGLQCMGRVWIYARQYASDNYKRAVTPITHTLDWFKWFEDYKGIQLAVLCLYSVYYGVGKDSLGR